ncbi:MAG: hypothetical protein H8E78_04260, partial [Proteobacteria bacterium]|nr:hypothetical protein [Pseudomonadota bacterium]
VARTSEIPLERIGLQPWLDVGAGTLGIYAAIAGTGWLLFGEIVQGLLACAVAVGLLFLSIRRASTEEPPESD